MTENNLKFQVRSRKCFLGCTVQYICRCMYKPKVPNIDEKEKQTMKEKEEEEEGKPKNQE